LQARLSPSEGGVTSFRIELPLVPSLNNAYANNPRGGRHPTERVANWKNTAGLFVRLAKPPKIEGPYRFTLFVPEKMRGDVSNRPKLVEDLFVSLGVTPDDSKSVETTCRRNASVPRGRCVVLVESVQ